LLAFCDLAACGRSEKVAPLPSVLLVTLDTTRVDHLSCYGYERETTPNLDRLARQSVRFTRAWSTSSWTLPAHASLFTGLYPGAHGAHYQNQGDAVLGSVVPMPVAEFVRAGRLDEEAWTLAELLASSGHRTAAVVAGPWLHRGFGLLQGFEFVDDAVSGFAGRPAELVTDRAIRWLDEQGPAQPWFLFVNYFDPHFPYTPPDEFRVFPGSRNRFQPPTTELLRGERELSGSERRALVGRYDAEIRYMDHHLGRLLDAVHARGEAALIVVTADHGEAFGEGGRHQHTYWLSDELLRVPLLIRYPDRRGAGTLDDAPVQLVDVLPLVADELGLEIPQRLDGIAPGHRETAFAELYRSPTAVVRHGDRFDRDLVAAIAWPHKLVRSDRGEESLVRLHEDLREEPSRDAAASVRLGSELATRDWTRGKPVAPSQAIDPEIAEALRRLGYVE
jgi:arylsulfatase A-like enzyme